MTVSTALRVADRLPILWMTCAAICAGLALGTYRDLTAPIELAPMAVPNAPRVSAPPPARPSDHLVTRNMFCSDCGPAVEAPARGEGGIPVTSLPLLLVATHSGAVPAATLRDTASGAQGAYGVGDRIPRAGAVERIAGRWVQFRNDAAGRSERIELLAVATADRPTTQTSPARHAATATSDEAWLSRIRAVDERTFEVERSLIRELVAAGGGAGAKGVKITPFVVAGKLAGVRVATARTGSMAAAVGLRTGDVIEAIDGVALTSPDAMLEVLARLDATQSVRVQGRRGDAPLELDYRLR